MKASTIVTLLPIIALSLLFSSCGKKEKEAPAEPEGPKLASEFEAIPTEIPRTLPNTLVIKSESLLNKGGPKVVAAETKVTGSQSEDEAKIALPESVQGTAYTISGLGVSGSDCFAIINKQVLRVGTEIAPGVILQEVRHTYAVFNVGGTLHLIRPEDIQSKLEGENKILNLQ
ncbi:MAG TPA: hypothetical protein VIR63_00190 [Pontiella sp.]